VEGVPIDQFCTERSLNVDARLDLFRSVCSAVDYAHRNLVIHRDLKPSNVLVTADGVPKLLDFGIAKIISQEFSPNAETITKMGVMTPAYASPEQLGRDAVTTLSDVYSLGVILFEMLSGRRPFQSEEGDVRDIFKAILETEPKPPSSVIDRISTDSRAATGSREQVKNGGTERQGPAETRPETTPLRSSSVRGDLDNIVLKALRKEPERRYPSALAFAEDLRRHQLGLTVTARPNTLGYRASKFVRRNKIGVGAGLMVVAAVIIGIAATLWQANVARAERVRAEKRFNDVRQLANANLFQVYPEIENVEGSIKAREALLTNTIQYLDSLYSEVADDAELQAELATAYEKVGDVLGAMNNSSLGDTKSGIASYEKARNLREAVLTAKPTDIESKQKLANNHYVLGRTLWNDSRTAEAEASFGKGITLQRELAAAEPTNVRYKDRLAVMLLDSGNIPAFNFQAGKAMVLFGEALEIIRGLIAAEPENMDLKKSLARGIRAASKAQVALGDYDGAIRDLSQAVEVSQQLAQAAPKDFRIQRSVWLTENIICEVYVDSSNGAKAVRACSKVIAFPTDALAKEPDNGVVRYDLAISHFNLARAYRISERPADSISSASKAVEVMNVLIAKNPADPEYKRNLAIYNTEIAKGYISLGKNEDAVRMLSGAISTLEPICAADPSITTYQYDLGVAHRLSAQALFRKGERAEAARHVDAALEIVTRLQGSDSLRDSDKDLIKELQAEKAAYTS
jgi:eukaryotic-like serine/threonine-protein kinase